ncbi:hypothetical protein BYT27DRAFT_7264526 [Phlegmacium glaucopus]|nr:hypothetical protein BYT27DRAFT_7264526 [Phlegmacium glaucopus]
MDSRSGPPTRTGRAYTSPWPSVESLSNTNTAPVLKKRHSAYALSNPPIVSDHPPIVSDHPPIRPPRHPARVNSIASSDSKQQSSKPRVRRPSTATGSSEAVTSWEGSSRKSTSPSVNSRTSSLGLTMHTGPVEEVTPWELYPIPPTPSSKDSRASTTSAGHLKNHKPTSTPHIPPTPHKPTFVSTGPTEEVTPWELLPGPSQNGDVSLKQPLATPRSPPPRRPSSNSENLSVPVYPRSTATGPAEDVTPWELTPVPTEGQELEISAHVRPSRTRSSLSLTMAQLEQVTPWELYPAPKSSGSNLSGQTQTPIGTTRQSSSSNPSKTLSEVGHRSRRSTSGKTSKAARSSIPATGILNIPQLPVESTALTGQQKGISSNGAGAGTGSPAVSITPPTSASSSKHDPQQPSSHDRQDLKFSTADRTILEQLKMNIRAREAQFVVKGIGNMVVGGGKSPGKKHHSYSAKEVPYPRSYGREVVDLDVWETMFCLDICESLTWHVFGTPPTKVLEIGCGTGTWILHCAQNWKECHFVGLDIVPLHPDLQNVGSPDLASRITWVQHNFLDGLPFQNEEFDFVHIKRIALGVPEDKWDTFFEEIARVMKPGAAFEMVEEDLFFPGKSIDDNDEGSIRMDDSSSITCGNSTSSDHRRASVNGFPTHDDEFDQGSPKTPTTSTTLLLRTPSRSNSPARSAKKENRKEVVANGGQISHDSSSSLPTISVPTATAPTNAPPMHFPNLSKEPSPISLQHWSFSRPLLSVQTEQPHSKSGVMGTNPAGSGPSSISLLGAITVNDTLTSRTRSSSVQTSSTNGSKAGVSSLSSAASLGSETKPSTTATPFLLRMLTQTPTNPRDHSLLETIWTEMLSSRWINLSPLSLLTTYLEWHFKDVRTHPPLMYTFPPTAPKPELVDDDVDSDSDLDIDGTPNVANPRPKLSPSIKRGKYKPVAPHGDDKGKLTEKRRLLSLQPQQQQSPSVTLDGTRGNAYSPSQQANFATKRMSRLPTTTLNIDLRTLNLHLALRAKEILACSESMWEWVEEFQRTSETSIPRLNGPSSWSMGVTRCAILEMTREDFDHLLNNFTMDFQDRAAVGYALQERFNWHVIPSRRLQDRKVFDKACKKYDKWVLAEQMKLSLCSDHKPNGKITDTRNSFSTPNINPSTHYSSPAIARSHSSPEASFQNDGASLAHVSSHPSDPAIHPASPPPPSAPHLPTQLSPTRRLSRSMRVFVAWKAGS